MNLLYPSCRGIMPYMKNQLQWISRTVLVKENNIEEAGPTGLTDGAERRVQFANDSTPAAMQRAPVGQCANQAKDHG